MSIRTVIGRFGGIRPMAEKLGHRHHTTVQGWWDRGIVPAQRQREVLDAAATHGVACEPCDLIPARAEQALAS